MTYFVISMIIIEIYESYSCYYFIIIYHSVATFCFLDFVVVRVMR